MPSLRLNSVAREFRHIRRERLVRRSRAGEPGIVFRRGEFARFAGLACLSEVPERRLSGLEGGDRNPSRRRMRWAVMAAMRGPGARMPARFRGSAPLIGINRFGARLLTFRERFRRIGAGASDCFGQRELLAADAADEMSASNLALSLQPPVDREGFRTRSRPAILFRAFA